MDSCGYVQTTQKLKLQPLHIDDLITVSVGEIMSLLIQCCCVECGGELKFSKINGSTALCIEQQCVKCDWVVKWLSSPKITSYKYKNVHVDSARGVVGALLSGATHRAFAEGQDLAGQRHLTEDTWGSWEERVGDVVEKMLEVSERKARQECVNNKKFDVAMDCRWASCGFNAEEGTVTCCDIKGGKVIYHSHLL